MPDFLRKSLTDFVSEIIDVTPAPTLSDAPNRYALQVETALHRCQNDRRDIPSGSAERSSLR